MKLTTEEIRWIETVLDNIAHGEARLIICDKRIAKIITEAHKIHEKPIDKET